MKSTKPHNTVILIAAFLFLFTAFGCGPSENSDSEYSFEEEEQLEDEGIYSDGEYCADVEYYNPNTGTRSSYTLNVEVENNELTLIHWPNGGWLDDSHFIPEELDGSGFCSFINDRGYQFEVQINGEPCNYTDGYRMESQIEEDEQSQLCPNCGFSKFQYEELCSSCERKERDLRENTCSRCGGYEPFVYGGLCNMCEDED